MSLERATLLGHYEITAKLGEGGMGEVYRARDSKLGRDVAIKVLPASFAADPERLARFEREARLLASLNHPHIAAIYGVEESNGVRALVMELVEGPTLAERIAQGPVPIAETLAIARQVAEALEAAHERGVVHRDLKPANIKLGPDGRVKVLDFGLAKAFDPQTSADLAASPTVTAMATQHGVILGTAAYMSPEQARGQAVDKRSDIWAFGCVLYEMLTGSRAFAGDTVSDTLAAILRAEVDWSALPSGTPIALRRLLAHCLEKDRRKRLHDIGDASFELDESMVGAPAEAREAAALAGGEAAWRRILPWVLAAGAIALLVASVWWPELGTRRASRPPGAVMRFPLSLPPGYIVELNESSIAISPDGRRQVAVVRGADGKRGLLVRQIDEIEPRLLPDTELAISPFFSPDGEWIAYFAGGEIKKIAFAGGPPVTVAAGIGQNRGGTWGRDGMLYVTPHTEGGLSKVSAQGGARLEPVTQLDLERSERTHRWPQALPDGKAVLFTSDTTTSTEFYDDARIEAVVLATGERKVVLDQSSRAQYLPLGYLVFARGGALFVSPFDLDSLAVTGPPNLVLPGVATDVATGAAQYAVSEAGSLAYVPGGLSEGQTQPQWVDRGGYATPALPEASNHFQLSLAPDGRRVALVSAFGQNTDVWIADLVRGSRSRFTFEGSPQGPVWTPDGRRLAFSATVQSGLGSRVLWRSADGSGEAETLLEDPKVILTPTAFSSDGELLAMDAFSSGKASDIWILPLSGDPKPWPFAESRFEESGGVFSPDGRWLAHSSDESGRREIYVRSLSDRGARWQVSTAGGFEPRWSADGKELFYRERGTLYRVAIEAAGGFSTGKPERLFDGVRTGLNQATYSVARDGRFLILPPALGSESATQFHLILNWSREVERLSGRAARE